MMKNESLHWEIFRALFNPACVGLKIAGVMHPIKVSKSNGCRYLWYQGIMFMEQNPNKKDTRGHLSGGAEAARNGSQIVWGIKDGEYIYKLEN